MVCAGGIATYFIINKLEGSGQSLRQPLTPLDTHNYFPLSIGNSWRYRVDDDGQGVYEYKIDRQLSHSGRLCFEVRMEREGPNPRPMLFANQKNGIAIFSGIYDGYETFDFDSPFVLLPSPLKSGAKWQWRGITLGMQKSFDFHFMGLENCIVPAGENLKIV